ncbi:cupin domain-containing protein [Vibrio breoganii]|uniref:50S ribosomal protein L16 arginine hydroxylase n=1 Tax=Vibrio breoganii TaxID=553239 RepID=A0AAP8MY48_9VIBR|nr:cupin domain-containing protein [Vibrio breoganii]NMO72065.1 cupin domain-containing protein [Vibrio breoganii]NMR68658.1 cupin domain-containing protein [Vibrio breoganii]PML88979.1 50S ribosomal protein L16 arginine hydroxylase [Vibrio breoganii]PMP13112.1 50S ribosomal protein L16 arginine hydroxylase [Vibrio breoganii]
MYQLTISLEQFLAEFWQKKPTIIKGGFANFQDPISAEELAGLTMEEEVDSRFVSNKDGEWIAEHGPFNEDKYASLEETNWSIIVQAANHWHQGAAELVEPFKAMPQWLFDDLMISYSVKDGGVGPHIDQYDVFIVQGSGKRHWRVGAKDEGQYVETNQHSALRQIEGFEAIIDQVLEPGDILYIPPGFPHDGFALEPSMSFSIGFRSPKEQELISNFADYILANDVGDVHLHKPEMKTQDNFGQISTSDLNSLTEMLLASMEDEHRVNDFMGCLLSQSRHQLNIITPEPLWESEEVANHLLSGGSIEKVAGLRALYHEQDESIAYINGEVIKVSEEDSSIIKLLCGQQQLTVDDFPSGIAAANVSLLCDLINKGYWYINTE